MREVDIDKLPKVVYTDDKYAMANKLIEARSELLYAIHTIQAFLDYPELKEFHSTRMTKFVSKYEKDV